MIHSRIASFLLAASLTMTAMATAPRARQTKGGTRLETKFVLTHADQDFLEGLSHRAFLYFWEHANPKTGLVLDRTQVNGALDPRQHPPVASIASTGFGLTALCIGAQRHWIDPAEARKRVKTTLRFFADQAYQQHGWFYHWMDPRTGKRRWNSEVSSIDTALLLAGALTARQYFRNDPEIVRLANSIYRRVDFKWMLNGSPNILSMGWKPESGFLKAQWKSYDEEAILYLLAIGSPTHPIPADSWYAWKRPVVRYNGFRYISGARPLFIHQYSQAWIDFRGRRDAKGVDFFQNSVTATLAQYAYCLRLASRFPKSYSANVWGITASDSAHGYIAWGGPPPDPSVDGTVVPSAPAGSLMFTPQISLKALRTMRNRFGSKIYGRYGFVDAFNPTTGWIDPDVIGIDLGITLLSAENLRTGNVWKWFMQNDAIIRAMQKAGFRRRPQ